MTDIEIVKEIQKLWKQNPDVPDDVFIRCIGAILESNANDNLKGGKNEI